METARSRRRAEGTAPEGRTADAAGFDAAWASEFYHRSGSISMAALANRTQNCRIGSSILYGVGRSPLVLATEARDLDELSNGRLVLG
ncbi:LLM class flavin-dependent oxidoreductase, partial [Mycobacteroides abscessus]